MRTRLGTAGVAAALLFPLVAACDRVEPTAPSAAARSIGSASSPIAERQLGLETCSPDLQFTIESTNPWFPLEVGRQWTLEGEEEDEELTVQITVLDLTRVIAEVTTRVVEERESVDDELFEVSWNYYAQAPDGTICYFGEDVDIHEDAGISHEGAWCADVPGNQPGIIMPADPGPGMKYQMELAPGVAEDQGTIVGIGPVQVPFGRFTETIRVREFNPLDGDKGYKVFAAGTGLIVDGPVALADLEQTAGTPESPIPTDQSCGS